VIFTDSLELKDFSKPKRKTFARAIQTGIDQDGQGAIGKGNVLRIADGFS
jgi:hypothetical protein